MKNIALYIMILLCISAPSNCTGFLPGLVKYKQFSIADSNKPRPANAAITFSSENLLRTKVNGKLTTDITTSAISESLFLPLTSKTDISFARTSSGASMFYDDAARGTQLSLQANSYKWTIDQMIGTQRISLIGSRYSGLCDGSSFYPRSLCKIFTDSAATKIAVNEHSSALQFVHPFLKDGELTLSTGSGQWNTAVQFAQNNTTLSIPINVKTRNYSLGAVKQLAKTIRGRLACDWSDGSSTDLITKNNVRIGKTQSMPAYTSADMSFQYRPNSKITWETGWVSAKQSLYLRGLNINGKSLGLKFQPFNDQVDFKADMSLNTSFYHLGVQRELSDKWSFGTRYKLIHAVSTIDGDYVGRGFFGLISASGVFDSMPIDNQIHGLELSASYTTGAFSTAVRLEQLIPQKGNGRALDGTSPGHTQQYLSSKSTGGTSVSLTTSYAF